MQIKSLRSWELLHTQDLLESAGGVNTVIYSTVLMGAVERRIDKASVYSATSTLHAVLRERAGRTMAS